MKIMESFPEDAMRDLKSSHCPGRGRIALGAEGTVCAGPEKGTGKVRKKSSLAKATEGFKQSSEGFAQFGWLHCTEAGAYVGQVGGKQPQRAKQDFRLLKGKREC